MDMSKKMELNERDINIFRLSLKKFKKEISKAARLERAHLGAGQMSELEEYVEHLERRVDASLLDQIVVFEDVKFADEKA